jgi:Holliday junction resolvase RusA-like endonuclease
MTKAGSAEVHFVVYGIPGPQGSKSPKGRDRKGRVILVESSKKVKPWRAAVTAAAELVRPSELLDGPLVADMIFSLPRPLGHFGTGRNAGLVKPSAPLRPHVVPDLSKLQRSTEDALTGVIWVDDARVVEYGRAVKLYAGDPDPDALDRPGAVIRVRPLELITTEEVTP